MTGDHLTAEQKQLLQQINSGQILVKQLQPGQKAQSSAETVKALNAALIRELQEQASQRVVSDIWANH